MHRPESAHLADPRPRSGGATGDADTLVTRLAPMLRSGGTLLVASDFDGTLARLSPDPWAARIVPAARLALRRLAALDDVAVAFISGRTASDLAGRVRVGGATYFGNHGLERGHLPRGARAEALRVEPTQRFHRADPVARRLAREVPRLVPEPWLVVEAKVPAVAFHFRAAPDVSLAAARVMEAVERLDPGATLERHAGRRVLELRPYGAPAKGEAMAWLLESLRPTAALMLGDDRHDARAFAVLLAARAAGRLKALTVAVRAHPDSLPEVEPHADAVIDGPLAASRLLAALARLAADGRAAARSSSVRCPAGRSPRSSSSPARSR